MEQPKIDRVTFSTCVGIIILVCLPLALAPERGEALVQALYDYISTRLGPILGVGIVMSVSLTKLLEADPVGTPPGRLHETG